MQGAQNIAPSALGIEGVLAFQTMTSRFPPSVLHNNASLQTEKKVQKPFPPLLRCEHVFCSPGLTERWTGPNAARHAAVCSSLNSQFKDPFATGAE